MTVFRSMKELLGGVGYHRTVLFNKFSQISLKKSAKITLFNSTNQMFRCMCVIGVKVYR